MVHVEAWHGASWNQVAPYVQHRNSNSYDRKRPVFVTTRSPDFLSYVSRQDVRSQSRDRDQISRCAGWGAIMLRRHCPHCHLDTFGLNCPLNCPTGYAVFFGDLSDGRVFIFFSFHCLSYRRIITTLLKSFRGWATRFCGRLIFCVRTSRIKLSISMLVSMLGLTPP